ncbi:ester cyclase [Pseudomonas sp. dw_358]|uniref:ester cyclase n=1 Tax=Pseudomonas sp. dw_358 TaxID=2720083 RepID=UPI001BD6B289|nr:ester cyclase [Pseudomonas sp. dw_358]
MPDLDTFYRNYIRCLNHQSWTELGQFVSEDVEYNGLRVGLDGYRHMLERDFQQILDLQFVIRLLVTDSQTIAARLAFDCSPTGVFQGVAVDGRRLHFCENVFYEVSSGRIAQVWSVIDKTAVEMQMA